MFSSTSQPGTVSLFSSTSSDPLALFSIHVDSSLPSDSFAHFLVDTTSQPVPDLPATLIAPHAIPSTSDPGNTESRKGHELAQTVLHLQSPTLRTTYIRCPPARWRAQSAKRRQRDLGLNLPWIHLQVRNLGREWSFDVGVVDTAGREGIIRCSTFQKQAVIKRRSSEPPILHIPLSFPPPSSTPLTTWNTVSLHLPSLISHFTSGELDQDNVVVDTFPTPSGRYTHTSYVVVYASCRLRRIWFSQRALSDAGSKQWELELYGSP